MGPDHERRRVPSRRQERRSRRVSWLAAVALAAGTLLLVAFFTHRTAPREPKVETDRGLKSASSRSPVPTQPESTVYTDAEISAAANQLFAAVNPSLPENQYFTQFARRKISWIADQRNAGQLSIILLKNIDNTGLQFEALMASGRPEGKPVIVIARPRLLEFLSDGRPKSAPFSRQERNDFALALVHEAVHLQNPNPGNPANLEDRLHEEQRAWREVDVNVVRQFRRLEQPMNARFVEADDALRACRDKVPCESLRAMLLPGERMR